MYKGQDLNSMPSSECGCCQMEVDLQEMEYGCAERKTVFTSKEMDVLKRIRDISQRARILKERLKQARTEGASGKLDHIRDELRTLREMRSKLEQERIAASEERMRLLGYV